MVLPRSLRFAVALLSCAAAQIKPSPAPPRPAGQEAETFNLFWPGETDAVTNATYGCTYMGLVALVRRRLVALGSCSTDPAACNGYHVAGPSPRAAAAGYARHGTCLKTTAVT